MVTIIKLDNFELYEFDYNNADHSELLFELLNDREVNKYLGNVDILIKRILSESDKVLYDSVYVVYRDIPIGLITLDLVSKKFEICLALLSEYRYKA